MSTLKVSTIRSNTASTPPTFADTNGTEVGQLARIWCNFNSVTTTTINDSLGISSLTDNGTGDTTLNFTTAMPSINYSYIATTHANTGDLVNVIGRRSDTSPTTTALRLLQRNQAGTAFDSNYVCVAIFGD